MIIILRPPDLAGPLRIGVTGQDTDDTLRQLGDPLVLCGVAGRGPGWGVVRPSGLEIGAYFDVHDRVEVIEFGRPGDNTEDTVTFNGLDVFTTPAADLVTQLRRHTAVEEEDDDEDGHTVTAANLLLSFWRPPTAETPDDDDGPFFQSVRLARHSYYDQAADDHNDRIQSTGLDSSRIVQAHGKGEQRPVMFDIDTTYPALREHGDG